MHPTYVIKSNVINPSFLNISLAPWKLITEQVVIWWVPTGLSELFYGVWIFNRRCFGAQRGLYIFSLFSLASFTAVIWGDKECNLINVCVILFFSFSHLFVSSFVMSTRECLNLFLNVNCLLCQWILHMIRICWDRSWRGFI